MDASVPSPRGPTADALGLGTITGDKMDRGIVETQGAVQWSGDAAADRRFVKGFAEHQVRAYGRGGLSRDIGGPRWGCESKPRERREKSCSER